jgi:hypothetical protein
MLILWRLTAITVFSFLVSSFFQYKDGQITLILKKKQSASWEVQLKKGLEQATE